MFSTYRRLAVRLGRWPRRVAALVCLLLAGVSALAPKPATPARAAATGIGLRAGEVGVPVSVAATRYVHPGDRVGVVYSPAAGEPGEAVLVADRLRVLSVDTSADYGTDAATTVMIATDRSGAVRLAHYSSGSLRLIIDRSP